MNSDPKSSQLIEILDGRININIYQKDNDFFYSSESIDIPDRSYIIANKKIKNDEIFSKQRIQSPLNIITTDFNNNRSLSELFLYKSQPTDEEIDVYDLSKIKCNIDRIYPPSTSPTIDTFSASAEDSATTKVSYESISPFVPPSVLPSNITVRLIHVYELNLAAHFIYIYTHTTCPLTIHMMLVNLTVLHIDTSLLR